jgi:hypothetical protein
MRQATTTDRSATSMETEKILCLISLLVAGLVTVMFLLDILAGLPFGRVSPFLDVMFIVGGGFVLWQGIETYRDMR